MGFNARSIVNKTLMTLICTPAFAGDAVLDWTLPTVRTDGTAQPLSGPGALASTTINYGLCVNGALPATPQSVVVPLPAITRTITGLAPGTWCFAAKVTDNLGDSSAFTNVASLVIKLAPPSPPALGTVRVAALNDALYHSPAYRILASGARSTTLAGLVPIGTPCIGDVVFTYQSKPYRRVSKDAVVWVNGTKTDSIATYCKEG